MNNTLDELGWQEPSHGTVLRASIRHWPGSEVLPARKLFSALRIPWLGFAMRSRLYRPRKGISAMQTSARGRGRTRKPAATQWRVICRSPGNETGRTLFISEISRERAERWLEQNAPPPEVEIAIVDDREKLPFPVAPPDQYTIKEVPPSEDLANLLDLAKRGRQSEWPSVERQAFNLVQAVLHNARGLEPAAVEALPDLVDWAQEGKESRDEIRELLEVSQ